MSISELPATNTTDRESFEQATFVKTRQAHLLSVEELSQLNERFNHQAFRQLAGHLAIMGVSGYLWATNQTFLPVALPSLVLYGYTFAAMFAPMHECTHRTAFANNRLNEFVAWCAGLLSFYNSTFYRRYHKWHHRYTQISDKDPEMCDQPVSLLGYILEISGLAWWWGKVRRHTLNALGRLDDCPFVAPSARNEIIRSTRLQLAVYLVAIAISFAVGQPWFLLYWLLPLIVGQPILRAILVAEHTGCSTDGNPLTNTRTTLTTWPIRFLMWNMPFHAEHHLYASIPFHALPEAHQKLQSQFPHVEAGYLKFNRDLIAHLG